MSDNAYDDAPAQPQAPLEKFASLPWQGDAAGWADDAATRLQNYENTRVVGAISQHNADSLIANMDAYRSSLVQRTQADPQFVHTALDLAHQAVSSVLNAHPGMDDDAKDAAHAAITDDWQRQIAHAAVQSLGVTNEAAARSLLSNDRIASILGDQGSAALGNEISAYSMARGIDAGARQQQLGFDATDGAAAAALNHMNTLYDHGADEVRFPPNFALSAFLNRSILPADTAELLHLYGRLQTQGDAPNSNPSIVSHFLDRIVASEPIHQREIIGQAADTLRMADALHLAQGVTPMGANTRYGFALLNDAVQQGRQALVGRDGENGAAGYNAWGRYVNWLLPAVRRGVTGFTPDTHPMNSISSFLPTGDDLPGSPRSRGRSLGQIFGRL